MKQGMGNMLKQISEMQKKLKVVQDEIAASTFTGTAGGGLVKVDMSGKGEITSLVLDPTLMTEDVGTISDLVMAAINNANMNKEEFSKKKLASFAPGLGSLGFNL